MANRRYRTPADAHAAALRERQQIWPDGVDALTLRSVSPPPTPVVVDAWVAHAEEIAYRLASAETDAVVVNVLEHAGAKRALLAFRVEYVGIPTDAKAWVSVMTPTTSVVERLARNLRPFDASLVAPWGLPLGTPEAASPPCLVLWRCDEIAIEIGFLLVELIRDALSVANPARIRVRAVDADQASINARFELQRRYVARQHRNERVLGSCERCGRDLRDPVFAAIGIGPECIKSYPSAQVRARRQLNEAATRGRPLHANAKRPERWATDVRAHWNLPERADNGLGDAGSRPRARRE